MFLTNQIAQLRVLDFTYTTSRAVSRRRKPPRTLILPTANTYNTRREHLYYLRTVGSISVRGGFLRRETAREVVYVKSSTRNWAIWLVRNIEVWYNRICFANVLMLVCWYLMCSVMWTCGLAPTACPCQWLSPSCLLCYGALCIVYLLTHCISANLFSLFSLFDVCPDSSRPAGKIWTFRNSPSDCECPIIMVNHV